MSILVLNLLRDDRGRSTGVILESHAVLANVRGNLVLFLGRGDEVNPTLLEGSKTCSLHTLGRLIDCNVSFALKFDFLGLASAQPEDLVRSELEFSKGYVLGFEGI